MMTIPQSLAVQAVTKAAAAAAGHAKEAAVTACDAGAAVARRDAQAEILFSDGSVAVAEIDEDGFASVALP